MNFSAALLLKRSAAQLAYYASKHPKGQPFDSEAYERVAKHKVKLGSGYTERFKKEPTNPRIALGNEYAKNASVSPYQEMGNRVDTGQFRLYFSVDEIEVGEDCVYFWEHKYLDTIGAPEWLLHQGLIQTAFYRALAESAVSNVYQTSKFALKNGEEPRTLTVTLPTRSRLNLNGCVYEVEANTHHVLEFFIAKMRAIEKGHAKSKLFDEMYKHREWEEYFQDFIRFRSLHDTATNFDRTS